jgi:hypothetical protein
MAQRFIYSWSELHYFFCLYVLQFGGKSYPDTCWESETFNELNFPINKKSPTEYAYNTFTIPLYVYTIAASYVFQPYAGHQ